MPARSPIAALSARPRRRVVLVVVETPKGARNKYKFDEEKQVFSVSGVLPVGASFPFDFGFLPGTVGGDGDPLDVLLLMDEAAFPGCVVESGLVGVIEARQSEKGNRKVRNDRLIAVAVESHQYRTVRSLRDLAPRILDEIEEFFRSYNRLKGKAFDVLARRGPAAARAIAERGLRSANRSAGRGKGRGSEKDDRE